MSDEEKKAIDDLFSLTHINGYINLYDQKKANIYTSDLKRWQNGVKVLLNLFQKQQEEIEMSNKVIDKRNEEKLELASMCLKKDKIIDEMAEHIVSSAIVDDTVCAIKCDCDNGVECSHKKMLKCTKDYFKKKVEDK